jgi:hypothetical protein
MVPQRSDRPSERSDTSRAVPDIAGQRSLRSGGSGSDRVQQAPRGRGRGPDSPAHRPMLSVAIEVRFCATQLRLHEGEPSSKSGTGGRAGRTLPQATGAFRGRDPGRRAVPRRPARVMGGQLLRAPRNPHPGESRQMPCPTGILRPQPGCCRTELSGTDDRPDRLRWPRDKLGWQRTDVPGCCQTADRSCQESSRSFRLTTRVWGVCGARSRTSPPQGQSRTGIPSPPRRPRRPGRHRRQE